MFQKRRVVSFCPRVPSFEMTENSEQNFASLSSAQVNIFLACDMLLEGDFSPLHDETQNVVVRLRVIKQSANLLFPLL